MGDANPIRTLRDYSKLRHEGYMYTTELPEGNIVVPLWSDTIRMTHLTLTVQIGKERACIYFNFPFAIKQAISLNVFQQDSSPHRRILLLVSLTNPQGGSVSIHSSSYQIKLEKALLDFDSHQEKRFFHLKTQLGQQQDDMIGKINLLWKTISENLNDVSSLENAGNSITPRSIAATSHDKREELRKKGIKSYDTEEEDVSSTNACDLNLGGTVKRKEGVKEQGKEENEMETNMKVDELIEEESEFETDEEVEEILKEEEDDSNGENFNLFPTMEELTHHEWLLNNPRPPWVKARIRA
ncbi:hypothetical protein Tco_1078522 [Tanacetum coccineum]|uniref:Uncharacterized protein n=1 Tax=Tanacetum coccineum TaxID=301880 RepID=A0ABQ5HQR9_9ASTR